MTIQDVGLRTQDSTFGARRPHKRGNPAVRLMPLVFAAVMVGVVAAGLWNAANATDGSAPTRLGALRLTQTVTGSQAVAEMSRLHGKGIGVVDGYVAHYDGASGGAVLYVGEAASEGDATALLKQMEERIVAGNQYFTDLAPLTVEGIRVLAVRSKQEMHYFWQAGSKVVWIGFDRDDASALRAAVTAIR